MNSCSRRRDALQGTYQNDPVRQRTVIVDDKTKRGLCYSLNTLLYLLFLHSSWCHRMNSLHLDRIPKSFLGRTRRTGAPPPPPPEESWRVVSTLCMRRLGRMLGLSRSTDAFMSKSMLFCVPRHITGNLKTHVSKLLFMVSQNDPFQQLLLQFSTSPRLLSPPPPRRS